MERIAGDDEEAARLLVERWQSPVFAFLLRMLGSREEAEDLAQEVFLRACRSAGRYRAEGRFRSWLFRIAGNLARSALRRRKVLRWVRFEPGVHDRAAPSGGADRALEQQERKEMVRRALDGLPPRQREAMLLRRYEGMSYREIAETMKVSVPSVESLLQRAMQALRHEFRLRGDTI
jgi:RNA polymerase sigma-70 factor (ECF subfamily)